MNEGAGQEKARAPKIRTYLSPDELRAQEPERARAHRSLLYAMIDGYRPLEMDVFVPAQAKGPVPCVVWIHGGGFMMGSRLHVPREWPAGAVFQLLVDHGIAVASIDYRHAKEAPFPAQLHDAKAAIRYIRAYAAELGVNPERIGVWGESAGGQLAALVALADDEALEGGVGIAEGSSAVQVVVDFYGPANLSKMKPLSERLPAAIRAEFERSGGLPADPIETLLANSPLEDARVAASPVSHVTSEHSPPMLIVHGDNDFLVPQAQSKMLVRALEDVGAEVEFVEVKNAGHVFGGVDPMPELNRAVKFLSHHLSAVREG